MKLLRLSTSYPEYISNFYKKNPNLLKANYLEQKRALEFDAFAWSNFWSEPMKSRGYDMLELMISSPTMQQAWWKESFPSLAPPKDTDQIAIEQIKQFSPDVLWFDDHSLPLLKKIKSEVKSIKLVLGWTGSAIPKNNALTEIDCVISCSPETVEILRSQGKASEHMNHGFAPEVLNRIKACTPINDLIFIGQIIKAAQFHEQRGKLLESLSKNISLIIYSSLAELEKSHEAKIFIKKILHLLYQATKKFLPDSPLSKFAILPISQRNKDLEAFLKPPVYGLEMYQSISSSKLVLNIHADSSPQYASNMRLFETTGIGTCLITDWKKNLQQLFKEDEEVVSFKTASECVSKVKFLLENNSDRRRIASAGQKRTLAHHTIKNRSLDLDAIIQKLTRKS